MWSVKNEQPKVSQKRVFPFLIPMSCVSPFVFSSTNESLFYDYFISISMCFFFIFLPFHFSINHTCKTS
ncbi:hypothetical protein MtrunA17_Chr8g0392561 [Medicago truncatula]|uniref:Transmembrane protein n=1 Tax=Medicago truncatula TaxID=3880 RepID=I3SIF9_MEDTR|nr:unknown [Medicago truncatula]RHN43872.1 hypothetical protein MtrunA17_Chr8g0392561 [Medicago truncatula]